MDLVWLNVLRNSCTVPYLFNLLFDFRMKENKHTDRYTHRPLYWVVLCANNNSIIIRVILYELRIYVFTNSKEEKEMVVLVKCTDLDRNISNEFGNWGSLAAEERTKVPGENKLSSRTVPQHAKLLCSNLIDSNRRGIRAQPWLEKGQVSANKVMKISDSNLIAFEAIYANVFCNDGAV